MHLIGFNIEKATEYVALNGMDTNLTFIVFYDCLIACTAS